MAKGAKKRQEKARRALEKARAELTEAQEKLVAVREKGARLVERAEQQAEKKITAAEEVVARKASKLTRAEQRVLEFSPPATPHQAAEELEQQSVRYAEQAPPSQLIVPDSIGTDSTETLS